MTEQAARAIAALQGLAIGDALGMPTQTLPRREILERFGAITDFLPGPPDQPLAPGLPAGHVTDDTEQALLLADELVAGSGRVDPVRYAGRLAAWETRMRERGSLDLLGPSTREAVRAILAGVPPTQSGRAGTTNGAAMRITPVAIVTASADLARLVDAVVAASRVTHGTSVALAGAAAVAAAVSAAIDGATPRDATEFAVAAARRAAERGRWVAGGDVAARIALITARARRIRPSSLLEEVHELVGTSLATQESVPAAFALVAAFPGGPWTACCAAAGLGGDTDTIAAMAGAIGGALAGRMPEHAVEQVERVNGLDLSAIALRLLALR